jgi:peptide/nickel transport system ATP-binding protein
MLSTPITKAAEPLLSIRNLRIEIPSPKGRIVAVEDVDLEIAAGEIVGIVGESGCGKTLTAYSGMDLLPPAVDLVRGSIRFHGKDVSALDPEARARRRGKSVSMVFQEPLSALNPVFSVETQIGDILRRHTTLDKKARGSRIRELLEHVGIAGPDRVARAFPHELSGGMRQRVLIAMAMAGEPELLIADEPTTALDTTVQAQIMELLVRLVREDGIALLLISHDFGIVSEVCDRVYVMYAGRVIEQASVQDLFSRPRHPYSSALLGCMPSLKDDDSPLVTIEGTVPVMIDPAPGCRFAGRCSYVQSRCTGAMPPKLRFGQSQEALCVRAEELVLPGAEIGPEVSNDR